MRAGRRGSAFPEASERLAVDLRLALVIVERLLLVREVPDRGRAKAALEEPVRRLGGEHEEACELEAPRALLDLVQQRLAVAFAAEIRVDGERRELADALLGERVERGAPDDVVVVLGDDE